MKEHKTQILAALALALALGVAVPGAVFASEGTAEEGDAGIELLATDGEGANDEGDGAGVADDEKKTLGLQESVIELYDRVYERESFEGYRDAEDLVGEVISAQKYSMVSAQYWLEHMNTSSTIGEEVWAWSLVGQSTKDKIGDKLIYEVLDDLKADSAYTNNEGYKKVVDNAVTLATASATNIAKELNAMFPDDTAEIAKMDLAELVEKAETLEDFDKYLNLYESMAFLNGLTEATTESEGHPVVSKDKLAAKYKTNDQLAALTLEYDAFLKAAMAIDDTVAEGLYQLPVTGAPAEDKKPDAPDTGIVNWIESGALDMGTLTLIVSAVVAGIAGMGLIAKLYLKHKF